MKSIELYKNYKEQKAIEKKKAKDTFKKQRARIASGVKVENLTKKTSQGKIINKVKKKTKTRSQLVKELDNIFSRYIRMRDADKNGICSCITCGDKKPRKEMHNTHFISRSNYKYRRSVMNCWAGCYKCNVILHGNYIAYTIKMIEMFGNKKIKEMKENKELVKISTTEIREMIDLYSHYIDLMIESKFV